MARKAFKALPARRDRRASAVKLGRKALSVRLRRGGKGTVKKV